MYPNFKETRKQEEKKKREKMEGRNLHEGSELSEPSTNRTSERGKLSKQHQTLSGRKVYPYSGLHLTNMESKTDLLKNAGAA